ncbi:MAG: hypothetical protein JST01_01080 [Cyanobacteria bacterium SZAS TMP-1]|nr:hypothetical protein [Cyanobacteria bacterium SZAS TMP-1]
MPATNKRLVVIDPEKRIKTEVMYPEHYDFREQVRKGDKARDAFLVLKASTLNHLAQPLIREALAMGNLRVAFVHMDTNADVLFDKVQELDSPKLLRKLFKVTTVEQINRILHAWYQGQATDSIASAYTEQDELVVQACDLKRYRIRFADFVGLATLPTAQRNKFQIDATASHIFWPGRDVAIDLDTIRYNSDHEYRRAKNHDALSDYKEFLGKAIAKVMQQHRLTQADIKSKGGPTERHIYRLARGEQDITSTMIERLAEAHGLPPQKYIEELLKACDQITEEEAAAMSEG